MLLFKIIVYAAAIFYVGIIAYLVFVFIFNSHKKSKTIEKLIEVIKSLPDNPENYSAAEIFVAIRLINEVGKIPNNIVLDNEVLDRFWDEKTDIIIELAALKRKFKLEHIVSILEEEKYSI
jgi:hypothetical protein